MQQDANQRLQHIGNGSSVPQGRGQVAPLRVDLLHRCDAVVDGGAAVSIDVQHLKGGANVLLREEGLQVRCLDERRLEVAFNVPELRR